MNKLILTIIVLSFSLSLLGQEKSEDKHPVDIKLEKCLAIDINSTTAGMVSCAEIAREDWDIELNKYYTLLMNALEEDAKAKLRKSQVKWIEFRDLEYEFSNEMHYGMQGTMWIFIAAFRRYEIVKARAIELKSYYETYTFDDI